MSAFQRKLKFMRYLKFLMIVSSILLSFVEVKAQEVKTVNGSITGEAGEALQGVSVAVKNSATGGATTDALGKFSIQAGIGDILVFTHVGYQTVETAVTGTQSSLNVSMEQSLNSMEEVVVIGYGTVKRKDLTGSISTVKASDLVKTTEMSLNAALQGRAAGVSVVSTEGAPGAAVSIFVRAGSSITASNDPLYVIDGFPQLGGSNLNINIHDIETIHILKDASATAIYGSRGANGVIIITTKSGKAGKFRVGYDGYFSLQQIGKQIKVLNTLQYAKKQHYISASPSGSELSDSLWYNWPTYKDSVNHNWQDEVYRLAPMFSHNLSFTGGSNSLKVAGSMSFSDQDGIAVGTNYKKYTARVNTTANISNNITNSTLISLVFQDKTGSSVTGTGGLAFSTVRGSPYRPPDQDLNQYLIASGVPIGGPDGRDPLVDLLEPDIKHLNYFASINSSFSIKLYEGLTFKVAGGVNFELAKYNYFYGQNTSQGQLNQGLARKNNFLNVSLLNENTLNYSKSFGASRLDAILGFSFQKSTNTYTNASASNFPIEALGYNNLGLASAPSPPSSGKSVSGLVSYFGRAQYVFHDRYILTGTLRADGSSKFPIHKWGYFPSGGFAWRIHEERFMHGMNSISTLKLRLTYGLTGNQSVAPYSTYTSYGSSSRGPIENNARVTGVEPSQLGSNELKWETTIQKNMGIDLGLYNDRIFLSADFYIKKSKDLLLAAPLSAYSGFYSVVRNVGDMQVKGMEFNLNTINFDGKFGWSTNFNIAFNKSKVLSLNEGQESFHIGSMGRYGGVYIVEVGKPLGSIFGYVYDGIVNNQEELAVTPTHNSIGIKQGTRKYMDVSGPKGKPDGIVDANDRTVIGNGNPDFFGGFTNNFSYGLFQLSFLFTYSYGNDIINANKGYFFAATPYQGGPLSMVNRWTPMNPQINKQSWSGGYRAEYNNVTSYLVEDGSYLRLKNIQLAYSFNENLLKNLPIESLRVYVAAQNLLTLTHYTGYDPEVNYLNSLITPGADVGAYPRSKMYTVGMNIAF